VQDGILHQTITHFQVTLNQLQTLYKHDPNAHYCFVPLYFEYGVK